MRPHMTFLLVGFTRNASAPKALALSRAAASAVSTATRVPISVFFFAAAWRRTRAGGFGTLEMRVSKSEKH